MIKEGYTIAALERSSSGLKMGQILIWPERPRSTVYAIARTSAGAG
jgi:hypothetical protein